MFDADDLLTYAASMFQVKAFLTCNKLGIFAELIRLPRTSVELANHLKLDQRAVDIVLRAVSAKGLLHRCENQTYVVPEYARSALDPSHVGYIGAWLDNHDNVWLAADGLEETLRTGEPSLPTAHYRATKEQHEHFVNATHNTAASHAPILAERLDFAGVRTLLDIGGGPASYSIFFCQRHQHLRTVSLDLPESGRAAASNVDRYGLADRIVIRGGDYLQDDFVGNFDACLISHIIHAHSLPEIESLLEKAFFVLSEGGKLWIHDFFPQNDPGASVFPSMFAVRMLMLTFGGNVYEYDQIAIICRRVGFRRVSWLQLGQGRGVSVIEAVK